MDNTFENLYDQFMVYVDKGDEEGAKKFLIDNLQKFPEDVQDKITFAFFEEAIKSEAEDIKNIGEMQREGLDAMGKIDKAKKILEDQKRVEDLRSGLTK
jgi:hypothetical protein